MTEQVQIMRIEATIRQWILYLMGKDTFYLVDDEFAFEDGMSFSQYKDYEQHQFDTLSIIYDLDKDFHIRILHILKQGNKNIVFFYLINHFDKIVCKMSITLVLKNEQFFLSSNDYFSQFVPKYRINAKTEEVTHIGLAIKTPYQALQIISPQLSLDSFKKGDNFEQDGFYHALFEAHEVEFNTLLDFYLYLDKNGERIVEKRRIFFDIFDASLKPYKLEHDTLTVIDERYPVHLSYWKKSINHNIEYPRRLILDLDNIDKISMTDCLDNDWIIL